METPIDKKIIPGRMLLIIDPQTDFINGTLPVPGAVNAMDSLAEYVRNCDGTYACKVITADWHPYGHMSFDDCGGAWPRHCVHDTVGAAIWPALFDAVFSTSGDSLVLHKGEQACKEEYSVFENPYAAGEIAARVRRHRISHIDICGLAGDICVLSSLRQGMELLPDVRFRVLTRFSPSIDGGRKLNEFIHHHDTLSDTITPLTDGQTDQ